MLKLVDWYQNEVPYPTLPEHRYNSKSGTLMHVYVFANECNHLCKIGITSDLRSRIKQVQSACGQPICRVLAIELSSYDEDCKVVEAALHKYFKNKRVHGEWFNLSHRDIIEIRRLFWDTIEGESIKDNVKELLGELREMKINSYLHAAIPAREFIETASF